MWLLPLEDRIGSNINFVLNASQTVQNNSWADLDATTTDENGYTRVNVTITPVISPGKVMLHIRGAKIINVSSYPPEFEIDMLTSSYVKFDGYKGTGIQQGHEYNFSVLLENPTKIELWLDIPTARVVEPPSETITLPVAELGSVTLKADFPVRWEPRSPLPHIFRALKLNLKREKALTPARHPILTPASPERIMAQSSQIMMLL